YVRDEDDEVRLARELDGVGAGRPVDRLPLVILARVVEGLAQRGAAGQRDAVGLVRPDRALQRGDVGADLRPSAGQGICGQLGAQVVAAIRPELHDTEPDALHVVEQPVDDPLGDADLFVRAGCARTVREVEVVPQEEVHRGAADASRPVPGRGQGVPRARAVCPVRAIAHGVAVCGVLGVLRRGARVALVYDGGGAVRAVALLDDWVRDRGVVFERRFRVVHTGLV